MWDVTKSIHCLKCTIKKVCMVCSFCSATWTNLGDRILLGFSDTGKDGRCVFYLSALHLFPNYPMKTISTSRGRFLGLFSVRFTSLEGLWVFWCFVWNGDQLCQCPLRVLFGGCVATDSVMIPIRLWSKSRARLSALLLTKRSGIFLSTLSCTGFAYGI